MFYCPASLHECDLFLCRAAIIFSFPISICVTSCCRTFLCLLVFQISLKTQTFGAQDHSDSDGESTGEAGPGRRFFGRKRRSTDASLSSVDRVQPSTEGRLRRMSLAMSRRPRASSVPTPSVGTTAAVGVGGPGPAPLGRQGATRKLNDDNEIEVATRGAAAAAVAEGRTDNEEETGKEKELLPPFTMALAVVLTGLRVFVVDQVRLFALSGAFYGMVLLGTLRLPLDRNRSVYRYCILRGQW